MYAQLSDIVFELMFGFDLYEDTQATNYAELPLVLGKPRLQRVGEQLQNINLSINFASQFCVPEVEFDRLNQKRIAGEVCAFIWGNGDVEGDFVITELKKTINALRDGNVLHMTVTVALREYYDPNKIGNLKKLAEKKAFAVDLNRPLPENVDVSEPSDGTEVMSNIFSQDRKADLVTNALNQAKKVSDAYNAIIDKAQSFVDDVISGAGAITGVLASINKLQTALSGKMTANPTLSTIAPNLSAALTAAQTAISAADTLVQSYSSMPNPVTTISEANSVLGVIAQTVSKTADVVTAMKNLRDASQPIALYVATGKEIDT